MCVCVCVYVCVWCVCVCVCVCVSLSLSLSLSVYICIITRKAYQPAFVEALEAINVIGSVLVVPSLGSMR